MLAYKGFKKDLTCKGFQYEIGGVYTTEEAVLCRSGFHACERAFDVLRYYPPHASRYCLVDLEANEERGKGSKRVGRRVKIVKEIGVKGVIEAGVHSEIKERRGKREEWENRSYRRTDISETTGVVAVSVKTNSAAINTAEEGISADTGLNGVAVSTGDFGISMSTGKYSKTVSSGYEGTAVGTGDMCVVMSGGNRGVAINEGDCGTAIASGIEGASKVTGSASISIATGIRGRAKGEVGSYIVLAEWRESNGRHVISGVKSAMVDGELLKGGVYYTLIGGEFVEC